MDDKKVRPYSILIAIYFWSLFLAGFYVSVARQHSCHF